ncbi:MAG: SWIM zinc finger family protein, partial [Methylococcaceae bacterium]
MERLVDSGRLTRGRSYARKGQVLSIEETKGGIAARVQGSRSTPYKITIQIAPLSDAQWEKVIDALAEQAIFTAQLLAGEMPQEIEQAFEAAKVSLFPSRRDDLKTDCSCPDYANPCKHVAATHYILGESFDEDPFLIFRLRGRTQEQVLAALRQRRAGELEFAEEELEESETVIPLDEQMAHFWDLSAPLEGFSVSIRPPAIELPLIKRLGEAS